MKLFSSALSFLSIIAAARAATCPPVSSTPEEQLASFNAFVQKFYYDKNVKAAFLDHVDVNYIQHNPNALSGRQTAIDTLSPVIGQFKITLLNKGFVDNRGWVHYRMDIGGSQPQAILDLFRFNGSCIMEHWDVAQARPTNPKNPLAMW